jgi:hypothetical protein
MLADKMSYSHVRLAILSLIVLSQLSAVPQIFSFRSTLEALRVLPGAA